MVLKWCGIASLIIKTLFYRLNTLIKQYEQKKKPPLVLLVLPNFDLVLIDNNNTYGRPNILDYINTSDPYAIFKLFFIDKVLDGLAEFINKNVELYLTPLEY
jgi:hypothetical protein